MNAFASQITTIFADFLDSASGIPILSTSIFMKKVIFFHQSGSSGSEMGPHFDAFSEGSVFGHWITVGGSNCDGQAGRTSTRRCQVAWFLNSRVPLAGTDSNHD
jgi:hypothetical protein